LRIGATNAQVVELLYKYLTKTSADANSVGYWTYQIEQGRFSQAGLDVIAAERDVNKQNINLVGLAQVGLAYLPII
jgi:serralysin